MCTIEIHPCARAAVYARVSSEKQAQAQTIASQVEALQERRRQDGIVLDPDLSFIDDGYSGATLIRPALERLRDMAAMGVIDRLYVHSPDRLARKYAYQVLLLEELRRCGVDVVFLNHAASDNPEEQLLLQVQGMMAEYERAKIIERHRRGKLHAARHGSVNVLGGAPYGYRYLGVRVTGGHAAYEIVLEQARVVRQIFAWVGQDRLSIREVCRRLQNQGIRTTTGKSRWDPATVWSRLKNPAYKGMAAFGKIRCGPMRPRLRPHRGDPAQPRRPHSVYDVLVDEQVPIPVPALESRIYSIQFRSNWRKIACDNGSDDRAPGICWWACWSVGPAVVLTMANPSGAMAPKARNDPMPTIGAAAVTPFGSGDNASAGTSKCASICWNKQYGKTSVPCSRSLSGSPASTSDA
jgi:site-specific DNA recombinase